MLIVRDAFMRLKRLNLHGFKTFAPRTDILFGEGLTAVVGPNGSGKSNIADSIRWVLGEQSLSHLRAKRTEDLIFTGSAKRAPVGMAEVSITIDNADHLLPLDFAEVTLTRRAYRSGENEYFINKSRVRLRDVLDIASTLGQAYTVVGQGLVDAALSLRPEERRELFEEAAAIRGYFVQREDALRKLTRTEENIARIADLVAELEPQVRRMERQARQAQEYSRLESELRAVLEKWYAARWLAARAELARAESREEAMCQLVEERRGQVAANSVKLAEARTVVWARVDAVSALHEQRAQSQARHAAQSQSLAVLIERISSASQQRQALAHEHSELEKQLAGVQEQCERQAEEVARRKKEIARLQAAETAVVARLRDLDETLEALGSEIKRESTQVDAIARKRADLENGLRDAERRSAEQEGVLAEAEESITVLRSRVEEAGAALDDRKAGLSAGQRAVIEAERQLADAQGELRDARHARAAAEEARRDLQRKADAVGSKLASLRGEQQASLFGGVRAVVEAAHSGRLSGFVGTVAELFRVPGNIETAIEAALGGRLQEVVMDRWAETEQAIALLKKSGSGRATFLPLDTLRATRTASAPTGPGIVGLARDLVEYDAPLGVAADSLLGRLLIVEDLASARRVIGRFSAGVPWTIATLDGEVVRPGGSVTGGSNPGADDARARGRTLLARERRRRELQATHDGLLRELRTADRRLEEMLEGVHAWEIQVGESTAHLDETRRAHAAAQVAQVEQQGLVSRLQQELAWRVGLATEARKSIELFASFKLEAAKQLRDLEASVAPAHLRVNELEDRAQAVRVSRAEVADSMGEGATRLAVLSEGLKNVESREAELRGQIGHLSGRMRVIAERTEAARSEESGLLATRERLSKEVEDLAAHLEDLEKQVAPAERDVRRMEADVSRIESEQAALQEAALESDTAYSRAAVEKQRCLGILDSLRIEVLEELSGGPADQSELPALVLGTDRELTTEPPWLRWEASAGTTSRANEPRATNGSHESNVHGPVVEDNTEMERQVYALKARLSRLGPVNPLAMEEHAALLERHDFLQRQLEDLTAAAESLRRVIGELDRTMRDQFTATFAQVNEAFEHYFTTLFGGGSARLELTNAEDVTAAGVELMAQPPGKRMQPLAALSGGERALTSAALLFALLKVRPVPFCVLDEVDAALDETNVTRFRSSLQELGDKTQFVVITHNRGTIEAANTLYGVSMAGDGTSQLLSLKVGA